MIDRDACCREMHESLDVCEGECPCFQTFGKRERDREPERERENIAIKVDLS